MEDIVIQIPDVVQELHRGLVPSSWQDKMDEIRQELSEMLIEVQTNKPYATGFDQEDEKAELALEDEIKACFREFKEALTQEPWIQPQAMKKLREAGDGMRLKVKELRKLQRRIYPGERISLKPDPNADLPQNRLGVHPDCEKGFKFQHILHAAGTQHMVAFADHSPGSVEKIFAPKVQCMWDMHQFTATF
mmetsp:Transcript_115546/g.181797  ORF Transcript_115546/g.181797 Transcript_115546/m.181797 type:complete len:191 (+) Transcript_115546:61-633(+)